MFHDRAGCVAVYAATADDFKTRTSNHKKTEKIQENKIKRSRMISPTTTKVCQIRFLQSVRKFPELMKQYISDSSIHSFGCLLSLVTWLSQLPSSEKTDGPPRKRTVSAVPFDSSALLGQTALEAVLGCVPPQPRPLRS